MSKYLVQKSVAILILMGLLLAAIGLVMNLIQERGAYQTEVIEKVSEGFSGKQQLIAPVLAIPYTEKVIVTDAETGKEKETTVSSVRYILPQTLVVESDNLKVSSKKVGIYQAQVYTTEPSFIGKFDKIDLSDLVNNKTVTMGAPHFIVSLSDTRGIISTSSFKFNNEEHVFKEGTADDRLKKGIHVPISIEKLTNPDKKNEFEFMLNIQGTQSLAVAPVGRDSKFIIAKSNWPHPSFIGTMLPQTRAITSKGFEAQWQSTWFANNMNDLFSSKNIDAENNIIPSFSVDLIETVDEYQLNERAVKYAILFIGLTFVGFVVFEFASQLRLHPIQYGLVGLAQVLFYLVLLALSEHLGFNMAYIVAASVSVVLISFYLISALKGFVRGIGFGVGLTALYGLLFIILQSEDFALLLGTSLLFIVLSIVMLATRKIDWYQLTETPTNKTAPIRVANKANMTQEQADVSNLDIPDFDISHLEKPNSDEDEK